MNAPIRTPIIIATPVLRTPSEKWSARRTVGFVVAVCSPFWLAVACAVGIVK